ncbi:hypothetical protein BC332_02862 [Capsicum chinense]|nr:hypothetical protein BC332_02862 [Capsicum chinense]
MEAGKKWYSQHKESKYSVDQFIDRVHFLKEYPSMDSQNKDVEVEIRGRVVTFTANTFNDLLSMPMMDVEPLKRLNIEPTYKYIHHLLCGTRLTSRWIRYKEGSTHVSFPFVHMNREARLWFRISYACIIHRIYMTEVLGLMSYGFGGLLTQFLWEKGVPEQDVDYKPLVTPKMLDFSQTKGPAPYGATLTMPKHQTQNNKIAARMYGLTML